MKTKTNESQQTLSIEQEKAIELLIAGKNDREVSEALNVNRSTVNQWRNHDSLFIAELNKRRKELWNTAQEKIASLFNKSVEVIEKGLESPEEKLRLETAKYLLERFKIEEMSFKPYGETEAEIIEANWEEAEARKKKKKAFEARTKHLSGWEKTSAEMNFAMNGE